MNKINNDLEKFCTYSSTYWDLDLPSRVRSNAKRNLKNLIKAWEKKNVLCDSLLFVLENECDYIKLDAASSLLNHELCPIDIKDQAAEVLKKIVFENKSGASRMAAGYCRYYKISYYDPVYKEYM
jgi:hypothetical protein